MAEQLLLFARCRKRTWCHRGDGHDGRCRRGRVAAAVQKVNPPGVTGAMMRHSADLLDGLAAHPDPSSARYWAGIVRTMRELTGDAGVTGGDRAALMDEIDAISPPP